MLPRAAGPGQDSPLMGARASCTGGGQSDGYRAHQRPVVRFVGWVQPEQISFLGSTEEPDPVREGKARAGTRRPSPCRVSAGRVFAFTGRMPTGHRENFLHVWAGDGYTVRLRGASATCRAVCLGGPTVQNSAQKRSFLNQTTHRFYFHPAHGGELYALTSMYVW